MTSSPQPVSWSLAGRLTVCLLLVGTYVLSVGPTIWLINHRYVPDSVIKIIELLYTPLEWVAQTAVFGPLLRDYAQMWQ